MTDTSSSAWRTAYIANTAMKHIETRSRRSEGDGFAVPRHPLCVQLTIATLPEEANMSLSKSTNAKSMSDSRRKVRYAVVGLGYISQIAVLPPLVTQAKIQN